MKTELIKGAAVKNGAAQETTFKTLSNGEDKKAASATLQKQPVGSIAKATTPDLPAPQPENLTPEPVQKAEATQPGDSQPAPKAMTLEVKLKAVEQLHRISVQRINLIQRLQQLETFEVQLMQDNDELEDNPYQGYKLTIQDDKRSSFVTTTPGLIRMVSKFITQACEAKLKEIEASINFPTL